MNQKAVKRIGDLDASANDVHVKTIKKIRTLCGYMLFVSYLISYSYLQPC